MTSNTDNGRNPTAQQQLNAIAGLGGGKKFVIPKF